MSIENGFLPVGDFSDLDRRNDHPEAETPAPTPVPGDACKLGQLLPLARCEPLRARALAAWGDDVPATLAKVLSRLRDVKRIDTCGGYCWRATDPLKPSRFITVTASYYPEPPRVRISTGVPSAQRKPDKRTREEQNDDEKWARAYEKKVLAALGLTPKDLDLSTPEQASLAAVPFRDVIPKIQSDLWAGWLSRPGITLLEGPREINPELLALDVAARVSSGRPMPLEQETREPETVLLLTDDPRAAFLRRHLEAFGADLDRIIVPASPESAPAPTRLNLGEVASLAQRHSADLVAFIPFDPYWSGLSAAKRQVAAGDLKELAGGIGAAVLLAEHLGGRHVSALRDVADCNLLYTCEPGNPNGRVLAVRHSKSGLPPRPLVGHLNGAAPAVHWDGHSRWRAEELLRSRGHGPNKGGAVNFLLAVLIDGPQGAKTIEARAAAAGYSLRTLKRAKKQLGILSRRNNTEPGRSWAWELPAASGDVVDG